MNYSVGIIQKWSNGNIEYQVAVTNKFGECRERVMLHESFPFDKRDAKLAEIAARLEKQLPTEPPVVQVELKPEDEAALALPDSAALAAKVDRVKKDRPKLKQVGEGVLALEGEE